MYKKVIIFLILISTIISSTANATTIIGVIGKDKIIFAADTRFTVTNSDGERVFDDSGKKVFLLNNGVGVAFAGDSYSIKTLKSGKSVQLKSVTTIMNDINSLEVINELSLEETVELIAEKYVNLLPDYSGEILIGGFSDGDARLYCIRAMKGKALWQYVAGRGSYWVVGSGAKVLMENLKENLGCRDNCSNMEIGKCNLGKLRNSQLEKVVFESMHDVIEEYKESFSESQQTTGGKVDLLVIDRNI